MSEQSTRRERIATAALQGLLASDAAPQSFSRQEPWSSAPGYAAMLAVRLADALIAELDSPKGGGL